MEPVSLRKKVGCVRQENACLTVQDEHLIGDLEVMHHEFATSKSKLHLRGPSVLVEGKVAVMSAHICQLEEELEAQARQLKTAELRADCCQETAAHNEIVMATLSEDLNAQKRELDNKTALVKRAEQQRNQALDNAEKLKEAFKDYKATISIKFKKVMESECKLKESLIECDREKEEVELKCKMFQRENAEQSHTISQLKEEVNVATRSAAERSDFQSQRDEARRRVSLLERQLAECGVECRELASLRKELEKAQCLNQSQEQRVAQSHREAQQSQAELASLEAILAMLHLREAAVGPLCAKPCMLHPVDYPGSAHLLKLKSGEGYQQLLRVLQSLEAERTNQSNLVERLQERLNRAQEEISSLQSSMAQRASHYQSLHSELLDKVGQATDSEKELKRKIARVAALEKQLQEKTSAYSQAALKNTELESDLLDKTRALQHYQSLMAKKQREYQQSMDKCEKAVSQQCTETQHRIEMLQLSLAEALSRTTEMEQELCLCRTERDEAQKAANLLQATLEQRTQEMQVGVRHHEDLLQHFKEQTAQYSTQVCELQSSLSECREELASYLQQMEDVKMNYEGQLQKSNDKVSCLQEKLHSTSLGCQRSGEQNLQLQLSLQQQQTMLTESTARISELEESQSQLQRQVSSLEKQLEGARASQQEEGSKRKQEVQRRDEDLQRMNQMNNEMSESVNNITSEMVKYRGELLSKESELQRLRRDVSVKTSRIAHMEESLLQTKSNLTSKTDMVLDLEEKLHRCEANQLNYVQRVRTLEGQVQTVRGELTDTLEQLLKLKDILQTTQTLADERQASVEKLTAQLSEAQRDLEERTHEVLDMDNALKERQGELQQRAQLLGQLDAAIREHKQEMARKVASLQRSLETRERELRDARTELGDRGLKESLELGQQLRVCQQKLLTVQRDLEETQGHYEALARELDATNLQMKEKDIRLCGAEEELSRKEARWLEAEARLKSSVASLERELQLERERHSEELDSLQQSRGQLLKVSEQISSTMLSSQEQLAVKLQQSQTHREQADALLDQTKRELDRTQTRAGHLQTQLDQSRSQLLQSETQLEQSRTLHEQTRATNRDLQARLDQLSAELKQARDQAARLQTQLQAYEKSMETSNESMLIKESEVTRLQAKISSLGRAADLQNLVHHALSLPDVHQLTHSPEGAKSPFTSPPRRHAAACPLIRSQSTRSRSPTCTPGGPLPPAHTYLRPDSALHLSESDGWPRGGSVDSSLDLPPSLKAALREALGKQPWETSSASSFSSYASPFPDDGDRSWQGLGAAEAAANPDLSFNPLTYMADKPGDGSSGPEEDGEPVSESRRGSACTLVAEDEEEEADMTSLTGMLRFVNQTLANQDDPSLWSSAGLSQT